jgi:hypothetical protein
VAARYVARERVFTGLGPNLVSSTAVFAVDDLSPDECRTLAESVQRYFDSLHDNEGAGPWYFDLGPSAEEDPTAFINLKVQWNNEKEKIDSYRESPHNSWQADIFWINAVASEHVDVIRRLRAGQMPTVYLQVDGGGGFETFDLVDCLTWDEIDTLETLLNDELYAMGLCFRVITDWHAEREPASYVKARMDWNRLQVALKDDSVGQNVMAAMSASSECLEEIKQLRHKPMVYGSDEDDAEANKYPIKEPTNGNGQAVNYKTVAADESLRSGYRDPDNYWRNVWLYEQRKAGKTNAAILTELANRAAEFAPLDSENALRSAIDSIANHHRWQILKGKAGRPRVKSQSRDSQLPITDGQAAVK